MAIAFESDGRPLSKRTLMVRGLAALAVIAALVAAMLAKSEGVFEKSVPVSAALVNVGDGLPPKSDVKFQGVLVGLVRGVTPSSNGGPNYVDIDLLPRYASRIPDTVTARVVPSNVFAVPSIQLVDNGPGPALAAGAQIQEDHSLATVRLQTSLTLLSRIVAAVGRTPGDPTLGILALLDQATSGRGQEALRAGAQLNTLARTLDQAMGPDGGVTLLSSLSTALDGLRSAAPDLLGTVHDAVVPLRAVAQEREQLNELFADALDTTGTVGTAMQHRTGEILSVTGRMGPVLDVLSRGGRGFVQMTTSETELSSKFLNQFWHADTQSATAKIIVELTPHRSYTRADCPRYGALAGPSCATAPVNGPTIIGPGAVLGDQVGGNVGVAGSAGERNQIASLFGVRPNAASDLLAGPLLRGNDVTVRPAPTGGQ